jgi:hypothetical protein
MKNVIIFQDFVDTITYGRNYKIEELYKYFRAQIDNSLRFGWDAKDIVVVTNLDFSYKDVTIIKTNRLWVLCIPFSYIFPLLCCC